MSLEHRRASPSPNETRSLEDSAVKSAQSKCSVDGSPEHRCACLSEMVTTCDTVSLGGEHITQGS